MILLTSAERKEIVKETRFRDLRFCKLQQHSRPVDGGMSSSTPIRRSKPIPKTPKPKPQQLTVMEPPASLFPSKQEFFRLIAVLAIASSVAFTCNLIMGYFNPAHKPFCDTNIQSPDSLSGGYCLITTLLF